MKKRLLLLMVFLLVSTVAYLLYRRATFNDMELLLNSSSPFAIRLALLDETREEQLAMLAQAIIYPDHQRLALYFVSADASYSKEPEAEPIRAMSPSQADRFDDYTGISSKYYIHIERSNFARLIDMVEGLNFFIEEPYFFENAEYQYPQGIHYYPGEHLLEYALSNRYDPQKRGQRRGRGGSELKDELYELDQLDIDRLFRQESLMLNMLWRMQSYKEKLNDAQMEDMALSLPETNLNRAELLSLFQFLSAKSNVHYKMLEIPLKREANKLIIKEEKARIFFQQFQEDLGTGRLISPENITVEILNGTEVRGLAARVKHFLQKRGLRVLGVDNYRYKPLDSTILLERSGDTFPATHLLELLSLNRERIIFRRSALDIGASFLIGEDFNLKRMQIR